VRQRSASDPNFDPRFARLRCLQLQESLPLTVFSRRNRHSGLLERLRRMTSHRPYKSAYLGSWEMDRAQAPSAGKDPCRPTPGQGGICAWRQGPPSCPIEASKVAICYARNTSTPSVREGTNRQILTTLHAGRRSTQDHRHLILAAVAQNAHREIRARAPELDIHHAVVHRQLKQFETIDRCR
jgi:hypothetical protein